VPARDCAGEVGADVEVTESGAFDEAVHDGAPGAGVFGADEKIIFTANGNLAHVALDGVIVDGHVTRRGVDAEFAELIVTVR